MTIRLRPRFTLSTPRRRIARHALLAAAGALMLTAAGCAAVLPQPARPSPLDKALAVEPMLSAAGFNAIRAETPKQLAQLKTLPPLQINFYSNPDGSLHYWYADPYHCQCIFYGPDAAYQRYEDLKLQTELAQRNQQAYQAAYEQQQLQMMQQQQMMMLPFGGLFSP